MKPNMVEVVVIIPALNEELAIGKVLADIPKDLISEMIVIDNNSSDNTAKIARDFGVTVLKEQRQGYGFACLKGIDYLKSRQPKADIVVFLDADYSDYPDEMGMIIQPIIREDYDLVIGTRLSGNMQKGAVTRFQIFGNRLATLVIRLIYEVRYTDLGPFRAIKLDKLLKLDMKDKTFGWTMEMQMKAAKQKLRSCEVPVNYRHRIGVSKITGNPGGALKTTWAIIFTILRCLVS